MLLLYMLRGDITLTNQVVKKSIFVKNEYDGWKMNMMHKINQS